MTACLRAHGCMQCLQGPAEGVGSPGIEVTTGDCEPPLCILGAEAGCSVRVTGALKHSTISPVLRQLIFNNEWYLQLALEKLTQRLS